MPRIGDYISVYIRAQVAERAEFKCEYCLAPDSQGYSFYKHQVDHVRSLKHRGTSAMDNLAYACFACNINKGPDVGSIHDETGKFVGFYNPRTDTWSEHFRLNLHWIESLTEVGWVTAVVLQFNTPERVASRQSNL